MEELVKYIVERLVNDKESVSVCMNEVENGEQVITVFVAKQDMGKVIGKNGKIAQSIRNIVKTAGAKQQGKYFVKFEEKAE